MGCGRKTGRATHASATPQPINTAVAAMRVEASLKLRGARMIELNSKAGNKM